MIFWGHMMSLFDLDEYEDFFRELRALDKREGGVLEVFTLITDVFGVMLFPDNPEWREELDAATLASVFASNSPRTLPGYPMHAASLSPSFYKTVLHSNPDEMIGRINKGCCGGKAAGEILLTIKRMYDAGFEGGVNKAVYLLVELYKSCPPKDEYMPTNRTNIMGAWQTFKPVSHLWAALRHCEMQGFNPLHDFAKFLAYAECFRHFATTFRARRQRGLPTLLPQEIWTVPKSISLPSVKLDMPPLNTEEKDILKNYLVPNRKHLDHLDDLANN
jgi:hypothetical protein